MRIIGGKYRGKKLKWTEEATTRPTKDRAREALFNLLENSLGFSLEGCHVLDLFAGTGSLVLEAISRGSTQATFVEINPKVRITLKENIAALKAESISTIIPYKAEEFLGQTPPRTPYDLVFLDPPYKISFWENLLNQLAHPAWIHEETLIAIETSKHIELDHPKYETLFSRTYGLTKIMILKRKG